MRSHPPLRFFLAGIMQGSHTGPLVHNQDYRRHIERLLAENFPEAEVYDPRREHANSIDYDEATGRRVFFRHNAMCREVDVLLAFVPEASMGTAIEMWEAYQHGAVVIAISPLQHNWAVKFLSHALYTSVEEFEAALADGRISSRIEEVLARAVMLPPKTQEPESFVDGPIDGVVLRPLGVHADPRGWLVELFRHDELPAENHPVMAYVSETLPGVARGPHHHCEQSDYFAFVGPGEFAIYLWDIRVGSASWGRRMKFVAGESNQQGVIIPAGVVHAYVNVSDVPGWTFNAANRLYAGEGKHGPVDEVRHEDRADSPYRMD